MNKKRILILREISVNTGETSTTLLNRLSRDTLLPLSTLKLNLKVLKALGLVLQKNSKPVKLTPTGKLVLKIIGENL